MQVPYQSWAVISIKIDPCSATSYMLLVLVMLSSIIEEIEQTFKFFCGDQLWRSKNSIFYRGINFPCQSSGGGLGIRRLRGVNISLFCKWLWQLKDGTDILWKRIIFSKYRKTVGSWFTKHCSRQHGCGLWKALMNCKEDFYDLILFKVGNGD